MVSLVVLTNFTSSSDDISTDQKVWVKRVTHVRVCVFRWTFSDDWQHWDDDVDVIDDVSCSNWWRMSAKPVSQPRPMSGGFHVVNRVYLHVSTRTLGSTVPARSAYTVWPPIRSCHAHCHAPFQAAATMPTMPWLPGEVAITVWLPTCDVVSARLWLWLRQLRAWPPWPEKARRVGVAIGYANIQYWTACELIKWATKCAKYARNYIKSHSRLCRSHTISFSEFFVHWSRLGSETISFFYLAEVSLLQHWSVGVYSFSRTVPRHTEHVRQSAFLPVT